MNKQLFEELALVEAELRTLSEQRDMLKKRVEAEMGDAGADKVESAWGVFTRAVLANWSYSPAVAVKQEELKDLQIKERDEGIATKTLTHYVRFTPTKPDMADGGDAR